MPVRNAGGTVADALACLTAQTYKDREILVFDDGSRDDTPAVIEEFASKNSGIKIVGSKKVGLVEALVKLVEASGSEFLARMDADDLCHPERLEAQVQLLDSRNDIDVASCLIECFPKQRVNSGMKRYQAWLNSLTEPGEIARDIFVESPICHPSVVMRREAYDAVGGYEDDGNPEDYGLWLRFFLNGHKIAKTKRCLLSWRESSGRLTRTDPRYSTSKFLELKKMALLKGLLKGRTEVAICGAGRTGKMWRKALEDVGIETSCFVDIDKNKVGHTFLGVPVFPYSHLKNNPPSCPILASVGSLGARNKIRKYLLDLGMVELVDFVCVA